LELNEQEISATLEVCPDCQKWICLEKADEFTFDSESFCGCIDMSGIE